MGLGATVKPVEEAGGAATVEEYQPRHPEATVLHRVVRENLEEFLRTALEEAGAPLPRFVERAFRAYLACGIPSAGFTRLVCQRCGHQVILAFSCKTRHLCPSCTGRHMEDGTAHLLDDVLPGALPYRQVVVSLPFEVRGLRRPSLARAKRPVLPGRTRCGRRRPAARGKRPQHPPPLPPAAGRWPICRRP